MRVGIALAAAVAGLWFQPAQAATIVQFSSNRAPLFPGGFEGFNASLGVLDSVTLDITSSENRLAGIFGGPLGVTEDTPVSWEIVGFSQFDFIVDNAVLGEAFVPISGSGSSIVTPENRLFNLTTFGTETFDIDPEFIPADNMFGPDLRIRFIGPGFYDYSDTIFSVPQAIGVQGCFGRFGTEEECTVSDYRLTYEYTPAPSQPPGAVPEPATWAMMLLGFAAIGGAMRSAKRKQKQKLTLTNA
jgi:hypothetical protein